MKRSINDVLEHPFNRNIILTQGKKYFITLSEENPLQFHLNFLNILSTFIES